MLKTTFLSAALGALFVLGVATAPAHAQATRTWISGVGDDANPCSRTAPCKTWAGAISKTATGGEIDALDPGGFGALTITKSITLDGGGGQVASTLVQGTPGMTINASSGIVILRNIRFNGLVNTGTAGTIGVNILAASKVVIEKCEIFGFGTNGIGIFPTAAGGTTFVSVQDTTLNNNGNGIFSKPTTGTVNLAVENSHADANIGSGIRVDGTGGGVTNAAISDSTVSLNGNFALGAFSGSANVAMDVQRVVAAGNVGAGVQSSNSSGGSANTTVGDSMLSNNGSAWSIGGTASLLSYKNNQVTGAMGSTPGTASFQ
jgi:hypothetical protein